MFSSGRDRAVIEAGGFFCCACLEGKPASEASADPGLCQRCRDVLEADKKTTELAREQSRQAVASPEGCGKTSLEGIQRSEVLPRAYSPSASFQGRCGNGGRPRKTLPVNLIRELRQEGYSLRAITSKLADEDIAVSARTIGRVLGEAPNSKA